MITLEELVDTILTEEGITPLLGISMITDTFGLTWKKMESMFSKCVKTYARRRPIVTSGHFNSTTVVEDGNEISVVVMPEGTLSVKAIRFGYLSEYPATFQEKWDEKDFQYFPDTRILKYFPPFSPIKVEYTCVPALTKSTQIVESFSIVEGECTLEEVLRSSFRDGTLDIVKDTKHMSADIELDDDGNIVLQGTLGTGLINPTTREMTLDLVDTDAGNIVVSYYPKYLTCTGLDIGDYIFYKSFALKLLESIAALKSYASQEGLHNIDLTLDDLVDRVSILRREVREDQKTISFSAMANI